MAFVVLCTSQLNIFSIVMNIEWWLIPGVVISWGIKKKTWILSLGSKRWCIQKIEVTFFNFVLLACSIITDLFCSWAVFTLKLTCSVNLHIRKLENSRHTLEFAQKNVTRESSRYWSNRATPRRERRVLT